MKSFADWTQELAEAQQGPKLEPVLDYRLFDNKIIEEEVEEHDGSCGRCGYQGCTNPYCP